MVSAINQDIRWEQRFSNYKKALKKMSIAIDILEPMLNNSEKQINDIDELQIEGLIQRF